MTKARKPAAGAARGPLLAIVPARALADPRITAELLRLLIVFGAYTNRQGECWPSRGALAERYGATKRHVSRLTSRLVELGYVERETYARGRFNAYQMIYELSTPTVPDSTILAGAESGLPGGPNSTPPKEPESGLPGGPPLGDS